MNRKKLLLCLASFFAQFSICMVNFAMIYYMRGKYSLSSSLIGIASSIYTVVYFTSCLAFSRFYPRMKRKVKAAIALLGMAAANAVIVLTSSIALMFLMLALYGLAMSFLWANIEDWIAEGAEGKELSKATNSFNFAWSFGAGLSTMIGGLLALLSPSIPISIGAILFILILIFLLQLDDQERAEEKKEEESQAEDQSTCLRFFTWGGNLLNYACYSLIVNIFPLYALDVLGYGEAISGTLLLFRGLATCFSFVLFTRFSFWQFNKWALVLSQLILSILFFSLSFLRSLPSLALFFTLFGIVFALLYEMSMFHAASGAVNRERRMIIHEVLINVGMVTGSSLGGIIYEYISFQAILYALSALAVLFVMLDLIAFRIIPEKALKAGAK